MSEFAGSLFIVGAQKGGTGALYSYIENHPQLACGDIKELHFFDREKNFAQGLNYYRSFFPVFSANRISFDATPKYLYYGRCAERIYEYSPDAKIVMLLREPVSRAFSAFNMYQQIFDQKWFRSGVKNANQNWRDFLAPLLNDGKAIGIEDFLEREVRIINSQEKNEEPSLIRRGIYAPQIERFTKLFGRENVLILFSDDLKNHPGDVVEKVLDFSGLAPLSNLEYPLVHARDYTTDLRAKDLIIHHASEWFEQDRDALIKAHDLNVPW
jgi:hypothetical protein